MTNLNPWEVTSACSSHILVIDTGGQDILSTSGIYNNAWFKNPAPGVIHKKGKFKPQA